MRLRSALTLSLLLACAIGLAGCQRRYEWRQKLTVIVETPEGEKSGSSVTEVVALFGQVFMSGNEVQYRYSGEATSVEVAPGQHLFALLGGSEERFYRALGYDYGDRGTKLRRISRMQGEKRALERENYPLLVTFGDVADPASVKRVDPGDPDIAFGCATNAAGSIELPWRKAGMSHAQWIELETMRLANERAAAEAGFTGETAAALNEYFMLWYRKQDADRPRREELRDRLTRDELWQWRVARNRLMKTLPATLPSAESYVAAAGGKTCYRIKSITLEITHEPVTRGRIREVLPCIAAGKVCVPTNFDLPYGHPMRLIRNSDFSR